MYRQLEIVRNMGLRWTLFRLKYEIKKRSGLLEKQFPPRALADKQFINKLQVKHMSLGEFVSWWKKNTAPFFFDSNDLYQNSERLKQILNDQSHQLIQQANEICNHTFIYFSRWKVSYKELDWFYNPVSKKSAPHDEHWTRIPDLSQDFGDIKYIWELSRFPFVYQLVRAYAITHDDKYVEVFWELVKSWIANNPPELGVNYKCGQEMSLRVMAWVFGIYAFKDHAQSTDERILSLLKTIYLHADHICKHIDFALKSVRNNHAISEALGLYSVGILFPFFDQSRKWRELGKKYLENEGLRQIYRDGSYLQHSMNYQRLVIQNYTWAIQLAKLNNDPFPNELVNRVYRCVMFLYNNQDDHSGRLPNYGMNDGALIHQLALNDYLDYRPQLNAAYYVITGKRLYTNGIHDESLFWIAGPPALKAQVDSIKRSTTAYDEGGYYVIRDADSHGLIRCTTYKDRPSQADMLSLDLWWKGHNILCDAGTYSYNTNQKWINYFNGTRSHNTLMINDSDQMIKGQRFIWYKWTRSKVLRFEKRSTMTLFEGEHYGYSPIIHRRGVVNKNDSWLVIDDVYGDFKQEVLASQQWLLGHGELTHQSNIIRIPTKDGIFNIEFLNDKQSETAKYFGDKENVRGWQSLYYGEMKPVYQVVRKLTINQKMRFITAFYPSGNVVAYHGSCVIIDGQPIELNPVGDSTIFKVT